MARPLEAPHSAPETTDSFQKNHLGSSQVELHGLALVARLEVSLLGLESASKARPSC
jgi:hypothetical protein